MKTGSVIKRGKSSWRVKLDAGHDTNGKRKYHVETVRGSKADANAVLAKRVAERGEGQLIERSAVTVAAYAQHWLTVISPSRTSGKTRERYGELIRTHITPRIGSVELQKLDGSRIDAFYTHLAKAGRVDGKGALSPQTCRHIHRLLGQLADSGVGVLLISSDLPEVLGMSDRVLVMRTGRTVAELDGATATENLVMSAAVGKVA